MAHFYEYLEFNSDEDRENQLEVYVEVKLSTDTEEKLQAVGVQGDWLVMAAILPRLCGNCGLFPANGKAQS